LEKLLSTPVDGSAAIIVDAYQGAISGIPKRQTAFAHRDALFSIQYRASWSTGAQETGKRDSLSRMDALYAALRPFASGSSYINYCDRDLKDWKRSYYGENLERLEAIKRKYDPAHGLRFAQDLG